MAGISTPQDYRIEELQTAVKNYRPGHTIRSESSRPQNPPRKTRIGLFGVPGGGKSALINSFLYVTGDKWNQEAPEGYAFQRSTTMEREVYSLTDNLEVCDNRGMREFSKRFMSEVEYQLGGVRRDGDTIEWDRNTLQKLAAYLDSLWKSKAENKLFEIHCAVIVVSAENLSVKASDLAELVSTIKRMTGVPPVFVLTHKASAGRCLGPFKSGLLDLKVQYVYEIENYTVSNHYKDKEKHEALLEALNQCTIVADRALQYAESKGSGCIIL